MYRLTTKNKDHNFCSRANNKQRNLSFEQKSRWYYRGR